MPCDVINNLPEALPKPVCGDLDDQLKKLEAEMEFYKDGKGKGSKGKEAPATRC